MAVQGDNHQLPFRDAQFNVVTASFALNSSDPRLALAEVVRVLVPGGRVVLQEWGMLDGLSELVADTIAEYAVEDPPPPLAELRAQTQEPLPWDDIETADELGDLVRELGLSEIELRQEVSTVSFASVGAFLRFKLAWPIREAELNAMPKETLGLCLSELQENLAAHGEADGSLIWRPGVFRVRAFKPAR
jgi:SAM-dependent methyltransferase